MRKFKIPQWIPTLLLVLLVPIVGYLVISNVEDIRTQSESSAQSDTEAQLIAYMHQQFDAQHARSGFQWGITRRDGQNRLVCYCDKKGYGWWYQVQIGEDGSFSATQVADTSAASKAAALPTMIP